MFIYMNTAPFFVEFRTADHMVVSEPYTDKNETGVCGRSVVFYLSLAPRAL